MPATHMPRSETARPAVGISSCLLGETVRFDGGHKCDPGLAAAGRHVVWVPFCPEVAAGLGVPRPRLELVRLAQAGVRVLRVGDHAVDETERMAACGRQLQARLAGLCGYVFKSRSPSCGLQDTPLFDEAGREVGRRAGLIAEAVQAAYPELPVADEVTLQEPARRAAFWEAVFALHRWAAWAGGRPGPGSVQAFHHRYRLRLRLRGVATEAALAAIARERAADVYLARAMAALAQPVTREGVAAVAVWVLDQSDSALPPRLGAQIEEAIAAATPLGATGAVAPAVLKALDDLGRRDPAVALCLIPYPPDLNAPAGAAPEETGGGGPHPGVSRPQRIGDEGLRRLERQLQVGAPMRQAVLDQWVARYGDAARELIARYRRD